MRRLALLGYGKMGREVGKLARELGDDIVEDVAMADVCIEFTSPGSVVANIEKVAAMGTNLVVGTTGWYDDLPHVRAVVKESGIGLIYGANFSIGIFVFKQLLAKASELMGEFPEYEGAGLDIHHSEKLDAPSGTAKEIEEVTGVSFTSLRVGAVPGTHSVFFDSAADTIELTHRARSRRGFALGALRAAHWIQGKKGTLHV